MRASRSAMLLTLGGHRVRSESDGVAGLATAQPATAQPAPPEIALIDVGLPGIDGYEDRAPHPRGRARGTPRHARRALAGYGLPEDRQRAFDAGFDLHLAPPVNLTVSTKLPS